MEISTPLLQWYHQNRRILPFREDPTPYHVWISEIMLQQTRVSAALPYYQRFMAALPDVADLAAVPEGTLLKLWEGLGYYSRARNLQKAAQLVMERHNGQLPGNYDALLALPGIGPYTAGAIASIAFNLPEIAVDGNVLRVFARLTAHEGDILKPVTKKELSAEVRRQMPAGTPGDYNQALMELGALVCLPGTPNCSACPLINQCAAKARGLETALPVRAKAPPKQVIDVTGFVVFRGGEVLLQQRPPKGLLAGMWQPPIIEQKMDSKQALAHLQQLLPSAQLVKPLPAAKHIFTHLIWQMEGWVCTVPPQTALPAGNYSFVSHRQLMGEYPLPNAFKSWMPLMKIT